MLLNRFEKDKAKRALQLKIPDLDTYIDKRQLTLLNAEELYLKDNEVNIEQILQFWTEEEKRALEKGFKGLRISGSGNWARNKQWKELSDYEKKVNDLIQKKKKRMKAICTYSGELAGLPELLSVGIHHSKLIACKENKCYILDTDKHRLLFDTLVKIYT